MSRRATYMSGGSRNSVDSTTIGGGKKAFGTKHTKVRATKDTLCQKCQQRGHYLFECPNDRVYKPRPTRTQQLFNKSKATPLLGESMGSSAKKDGTADKILQDKEKTRKRAATSSSSGSSSSDSDSDSDSSSDSSDSTSSSASTRSNAKSRSRSPEHKRRRQSSQGARDDSKGKARAIEDVPNVNAADIHRDKRSRTPSPPRGKSTAHRV